MIGIINFLAKPKNKVSAFLFQFLFSFLKDAIYTTTSARAAVAASAATISAASVFSLIILQEPFKTWPVELLGCFAYYQDLNIANRLAGITLCMLVALLAFIAFASFFFSMQEREKRSQFVVGFCLLPALFWFTSIFFYSPPAFDTFWLYFSTGLCWISLFAFLRERRSKVDITEKVVVFVVASGLSFFVAPALLVFVKSSLFWKLSSFFLDPQAISETMSVLSGWVVKMRWSVPICVFLLWLFFQSRTVLVKYGLYPVQIALLFFFCLILPDLFNVDGVLTNFFKGSPAFYAMVLPLFVAGVWDCTRRCIFKISSPFSIFPFLALLFFVFLQNSPIPGFSRNIFEIGARFSAFWVSFEGWASLFRDVYITYGLWDYGQYLFGWIFSGQHTAAASTYGLHLFTAFILVFEFFAVAAILPVGPAFIICLVAGVGPQSVVLIFISVLLTPQLVNKPAVWICVWLILSSIAPFARIPQGTVCVVASFPAFMWQALKLFQQDRQTFWNMVGLLVTAGFLMTIWPFGGYFWGLLRIFSETAEVNSPWAANLWNIEGRLLIQVLLGNAMLILPLISLITGIIILKRGHRPTKSFVTLFLCCFVLLYAFASISYGFSRIDNRPFRRQFQVFMVVLLPLLVGIMAHVRSRTVLIGCLGVLLCFATVRPIHFYDPISFLNKTRDFAKLSGNQIQKADNFGLPQLGTGCFPEGYLREDSALKKALDSVLSPDETFLDLTMVGLHYFSSERKMITEYPVYYVYPGDKPQLRTVEKLRRNNVNVALLEPNYFDDSPSSLRAYYLYRYALLRGLPWEITASKTLLVPKEYFNKIGLPLPSHTQTLRLLDKQFPMTDFSDLPHVWGRSYQKIASDLTLVRTLPVDPAQIRSNGTRIELPLQPALRGVDAGLLVLDVDMPASSDQQIKIRWVDNTLPSETNQIQFNVRKGMNVVPLDASPRWLLARSITTLTAKIAATTYLSHNRRKKIWEIETPSPATSLQSKHQKNCSLFENGKLFVKNTDPMVFYSIPKEFSGQSLLVHAVFTAPEGARKAQIFFHTTNTNYNENDSESIPVVKGLNEIYFVIPEDMSIEELRFDPGCIGGEYKIDTFEAKPFSITESPIKISSASLFQRPYVVRE